MASTVNSFLPKYITIGCTKYRVHGSAHLCILYLIYTGQLSPDRFFLDWPKAHVWVGMIISTISIINSVEDHRLHLVPSHNCLSLSNHNEESNFCNSHVYQKHETIGGYDVQLYIKKRDELFGDGYLVPC